MDIILYLLTIIQYLYQLNCWLLNFICKYIPLKQWAFDDSHSPKYQKYKIDELPLITDFRQDWTYKELIPYFYKRYGKKIRPIKRQSECDIPEECSCPRCQAPKPYLYKNNGSKGQLSCKVCDAKFSQQDNRFISRGTSILSVISDLMQHPEFAHVSFTKSERSELAQFAADLLTADAA